MRRDGKNRHGEKGYFSVFVVVITEMKVLEDLVSVDVRSQACVQKIRPSWYIRE